MTGNSIRTVVLISGIAFLLHSPAAGPAEQKERLTLDAIFGGSLYEPAPSELRWAPDGCRLGYMLPTGAKDREFRVLDIRTGEKKCEVSSEQLRKIAPSPDQASIGERERTNRIRYGVPSYLWAPDGKSVLFVGSGRLYLYSLAAHTTTLLAPSKEGLADPHFSPDGKWIAFVYQHDIWTVPAAGGRERRLTFGGGKNLLHGEPDWVYREELDMRSGYRWSPDSRRIAFIELDERSVPAYPIVEQSATHAAVDLQVYPQAGDPNPVVRAGIVSLKSRKTVWVRRTAEYIPRMDWADEKALALQLLNRAQNELVLVEANARTGQSRTILSEKDAHWVDVTDDLTFLPGSGEFLWTSDRSGFRHVYLYGRDGRLVRQITSGDWEVRDIAGVDEQNGWIYYRSNQSETIGLDLFRIRMDGSGAGRLTKEPGTHIIYMNAAATALADMHSSMNQGRQISVCDSSGAKKAELFKARSLAQFDLVAPEVKELKTSDGAIVRVLLYRPRKIEPGRKYPVVVYVYGMPGVPTIQDSWAGNRGLYHEFLVQQGFVVAQIDDRSSAIPGHKYAVSAYRGLGPVAAQDHALAIQYLKSLPFVDGDAMAVWGWSGGGFMAAYHMTHTNLFKAGIAVAPVTDWRLYDSIYTERYMGLPGTENEAYDRASAVKSAAGCQGRLLLVHGTLDDNVHPQNTLQLARALIREGKQFDLMLYPEKTHGIEGVSESIHLYTMMYEFLERNLRAH